MSVEASKTSYSGPSLGIIGLIGDQENFINQATTVEREELDRSKDKIKIENKKLSEISKGEILIRDFKGNLANITNLKSGSYQSKKHILSTNDSLDPKEYLSDVRIEDYAKTSDIKIAIKEVATYAKSTISSANGGSFHSSNELGLAGAIKLGIGEINSLGESEVRYYNVNVTNNDNIDNIVNKINQVFANEDEEFQAAKLTVDGGEGAVIEITSKETGYNGFQVDLTLFGDGTATETTSSGKDAEVYIGSTYSKQKSNDFSNVYDGVSFKLSGEANSSITSSPVAGADDLKNITLKISLDETKMLEGFEKFAESINKIQYFFTKNENLSSRVSDDIDKNILEVEPRGILEKSKLLEDIKNLLNAIKGDTWHGPDASPNRIKNISDLGFVFEEDIKNGVRYSKLVMKDKEKLFNQFHRNNDLFKRFLSTRIDSRSADPTNESMLYVPEIDKPIANKNILDQDLSIDLQYDVNGNLTHSIYKNPDSNITYEAKIEKISDTYQVRFEDGDLDGLSFLVKPKTATDKIETFLINISAGINNVYKEPAEVLLLDEEKAGEYRGSIISEKESINKKLEEMKEKKVRIKEKIEKNKKRLISEYQEIASMDKFAQIEIDLIEKQLNPPVKN